MFSKYDMIYVPIFYWSPIAIITSPSARSLFSAPSVSIRSVHIPSVEILDRCNEHSPKMYQEISKCFR